MIPIPSQQCVADETYRIVVVHGLVVLVVRGKSRVVRG